MSKLDEIKVSIESLSEDEYDRFRRWFSEKDWQEWDGQIEEDANSGKLDSLIEEAIMESKQT